MLGEKENILATVTPLHGDAVWTIGMASLWLRSRLFVKVDEYKDAVLVGLLDEFHALKAKVQVN